MRKEFDYNLTAGAKGGWYSKEGKSRYIHGRPKVLSQPENDSSLLREDPWYGFLGSRGITILRVRIKDISLGKWLLYPGLSYASRLGHLVCLDKSF